MSEDTAAHVQVLSCPSEVAGNVLDALAELFGRKEDFGGEIDVEAGLVLGEDYGGPCGPYVDELICSLSDLGVTAIVTDRPAYGSDYPPEKTWIEDGETESRLTDHDERPILTLEAFDAIYKQTTGRDDLAAAVRERLGVSERAQRLEALAVRLAAFPVEQRTLPPLRRDED